MISRRAALGVGLVAIVCHSRSGLAGTFQGYYSATGGTVGLGWSSDFGAPYTANWNFSTFGPHAGTFESFTQRNFNGAAGIGYNSARCIGTFPAVGTPSPGHIGLVSELVAQSHSPLYGIDASSSNSGYAYTSGPASYWRLRWSISYQSEYLGRLNFDIYEPGQGWFKPADGVYPGGTYLSGTRSGSAPSNNAYFVANGTLYQGQTVQASGSLIFRVEIDIGDSPIIDCAGDLNADNFVDDSDFSLFSAAYNLLDCADAAMPAACPADLNHDGVVDDADFVLFVLAYDALLCV